MKYNKLLWKMKVNQLLIRLGLREPDPIWYIGGSDVLPQPLPRAKEREVLEAARRAEEACLSLLEQRGIEPLDVKQGPAPMAKRGGEYRSHVLIKLMRLPGLETVLDELYRILEEQGGGSRRPVVEVDPLSMF